jgi:hypothetical protein
VLKDIDTSTNLIASQFCPIHLIQSKVFLQRLVPYVKVNGEPDPEDLVHEAPIDTCTVHIDPFSSDTTVDEDNSTDVETPIDVPTVTPIVTPTPDTIESE